MIADDGIDATCAMCTEALEARIAQSLGEGTDLLEGGQGRGELASVKEVPRQPSMRHRQPPALARALEQDHGLPAMRDALERTAEDVALAREHHAGLAHGC